MAFGGFQRNGKSFTCWAHIEAEGKAGKIESMSAIAAMYMFADAKIDGSDISIKNMVTIIQIDRKWRVGRRMRSP